MVNLWPFFNIFRRVDREPEPVPEPVEIPVVPEPVEIPVPEPEEEVFERFRSIAGDYPGFIRRVLDDPIVNPRPGPSNDPPDLPSIVDRENDNNQLSEASRRLRKRRLEQRIANREHSQRMRREAGPIPTIRSHPMEFYYHGLNVLIKPTSHRQERKFGLLVIHNLNHFYCT